MTVVPAGDHSANSVAEGAIRTIREMMKEIFDGKTHSVLQLQTFIYYVYNVINGIPFALNKTGPDNLETAGARQQTGVSRPGQGRKPHMHVQLVKKVEEAFHQSWTQERINEFVNSGRGEEEKRTLVNIGNIIVYAKLTNERKAGTSPLWFARVRSIEEGSNGRIRSLKLEYKAKPSQTYQTTVRSPDQVTVVAKKEEIEDYADV